MYLGGTIMRAVAGQLGQQHRVRLLEDEVDGVLVHDLHLADRVVVGLLRTLGAFRAQQAVEGELDGIGVEGARRYGT